MAYFKFFILGISFIFILMLTGCSNKETLGDIASNMLSSQYVSNNIEDKQDKDAVLDNQNNKNRGVFSWLSSSTKSKDSKDEDILPSKIIDNTIIHEESPNIEVEKIVETTPEDEPKAKSFNFFKSLWAKLSVFSNTNDLMLLKIPYKEDTISIRKGLNIVVLKVPQSKLMDRKITTYNGTLSSDFKNNAIFKNDLDNQQVYKDYLYDVKYKDSFYNKFDNSNSDYSLNSLHKDLINQLLSINNITPNIIYMFYRDCSNKKDTFSVNNQLCLSSYLYKIRAFIYGKNLKNNFIQEVKIDDLPMNQILLVLKPITNEQFSMLPKQTNLYNSTKTSIKEWLNKVNTVDDKQNKNKKN